MVFFINIGCYNEAIEYSNDYNMTSIETKVSGTGKRQFREVRTMQITLVSGKEVKMSQKRSGVSKRKAREEG